MPKVPVISEFARLTAEEEKTPVEEMCAMPVPRPCTVRPLPRVTAPLLSIAIAVCEEVAKASDVVPIYKEPPSELKSQCLRLAPALVSVKASWPKAEAPRDEEATWRDHLGVVVPMPTHVAEFGEMEGTAWVEVAHLSVPLVPPPVERQVPFTA